VNCAISFFVSSTFNAPYMCRKIRCDVLGEKFWELNTPEYVWDCDYMLGLARVGGEVVM
jgi:hypothetical protein